MSPNTQLWLDLADQLMLAFLIVFVLGLATGYAVARVQQRRATNATILSWVGRKRGELAGGRVPQGMTPGDFKHVLDFYERTCRK